MLEGVIVCASELTHGVLDLVLLLFKVLNHVVFVIDHGFSSKDFGVEVLDYLFSYLHLLINSLINSLFLLIFDRVILDDILPL